MSLIHHQIADLLRPAEDGVSANELALLAGRWWRKRISEMSNHGYTVGIDHARGKYFLIAERDVGRRADGRDAPLSRSAVSCPSGPVSASSSTAPERLFEPAPQPHWQEAA